MASVATARQWFHGVQRRVYPPASNPHRKNAAKIEENSVSELVDETKVCRDCRQDFTLTVSEQEFFLGRELTPPKRCKPCRDKRKAENGDGAQVRPPQQEQGRPPQRPLGVSTSNPITEYRPRFDGASRTPNPDTVPSRDDKNEGRRRRGKWRDNSGDGADW